MTEAHGEHPGFIHESWRRHITTTPTVRRVDVRQYLRGQRCTVWGRAYEIHSADGFERAAQWLEEVLADMGVME